MLFRSLAAAWSSTTSATVPTGPDGGATGQWVGSATGAGPIVSAGIQRINATTTTPVYLTAYSAFTVSTVAAYGFLGARRVR